MIEFQIWHLWILQPDTFYLIDPEVLQWLDDNSRNEYDVFVKGTLTSVDRKSHTDEMSIRFYDNDVAALFKMTWM